MNRQRCSKHWWPPAALGAVCAVAIALVLGGNGESNGALTGSGKPAPAWDLKDLEGKTVTSSDYTGKVVVLDFWATWCLPCREEIPGFVNLHKKYQREGLVVIGVSMDDDGPTPLKAFVKKFGVNYPVLVGDDRISMDFGDITALPTTLVIDRQGRIVSRHVGFTEAAKFEKEIKPLLK